jgi:hypothetical protein
MVCRARKSSGSQIPQSLSNVVGDVLPPCELRSSGGSSRGNRALSWARWASRVRIRFPDMSPRSADGVSEFQAHPAEMLRRAPMRVSSQHRCARE